MTLQLSQRAAAVRFTVALLACTVLATAVTLSDASAAGIQNGAGDGLQCTWSTSLGSSGTNVGTSAYVQCLGPIAAVYTVKRNGAIIYQAQLDTNYNRWSGSYWYGVPVDFSLYWTKSFGTCYRGATYQVVLTYATMHSSFYGQYTRTVSSGTPRAIC